MKVAELSRANIFCSIINFSRRANRKYLPFATGGEGVRVPGG